MRKFLTFLLLGTASLLSAQTVLINLLPTRPVFNLTQGKTVLSRTLTPGNRLNVEEMSFSGLGVKALPLASQTVYFLAKVQGPETLYRLQSDQSLVINASGVPLAITVTGARTATGWLADGSFALGEADENWSLILEWTDEQGNSWSESLIPGTVYRLEWGSPDGVGTQPVLTPWN